MDDRRPSPGSVEIAIVIVCRNALAPLQATIASVQALADPRVRLHVVDGASEDGTPAFLRDSSDALAGWLSEPDAGIYDAMNKGWRMAAAEAWVLYLGAGDTLLALPPTAELFDRAGRPWPVLLGRCSIGGQAFRSRWGAEMHLRNTAHHQALLLHKPVSPEPPFDTRLRVYGDWDFNLRLLRRGLKARPIASLQTHAEPGGVSWHHDLDEIRQVAQRHGGRLAGIAAYVLNSRSLRRRMRRHG